LFCLSQIITVTVFRLFENKIKIYKA